MSKSKYCIWVPQPKMSGLITIGTGTGSDPLGQLGRFRVDTLCDLLGCFETVCDILYYIKILGRFGTY